MNLSKTFNIQTVVLSSYSGAVFATAFWMVIYMALKTDATLVFYIPPILAVLFLVPLLPFSVNLILEREDSFGDDDVKFRRNVLFLLMGLQFVPVLISIWFVFLKEGVVHPDTLLIQLLASIYFLMSSLFLKFGNYRKAENSDSF